MTAPGSLSTRSPAGRAPLLKKRRDGSMYSQAYVRTFKCCGRQTRALLSVIVFTEKVFGKRMRPLKVAQKSLLREER